MLYGTRDIHMLLTNRLVRLSGWKTKQGRETTVDHPHSGGKTKIFHIEPKCPILFYINEMSCNQVDVAWFSVGGQSHHLVFIGIDLKTEVVRKSGIKQPQTVREVYLPQHLELMALPTPASRGCPLPNSINTKDRRFMKRSREEGRSRMRLVMVSKQNLRTPLQ